MEIKLWLSVSTLHTRVDCGRDRLLDSASHLYATFHLFSFEKYNYIKFKHLNIAFSHGKKVCLCMLAMYPEVFGW